MPSFRPAAGKHLTAIRCLHPLTETMNTFASPVMWLECTFHNFLFKTNLMLSGCSHHTVPGERGAKVGGNNQKIKANIQFLCNCKIKNLIKNRNIESQFIKIQASLFRS